MGGFLTQIGISALTTSVILSFSGVLFKRVIERWLDGHFERRAEQLRLQSSKEIALFQAELETIKDSAKAMRNERLQRQRDLIELVYRIKSRLRWNLDTRDLSQSVDDMVREVTTERDNFAEGLYRSRYLLSEREFELLHSFKHMVEDVWATVIVMRDSPEQQSICKEQLRSLYRSIDELGDLAIGELKANFNSSLSLTA